MADTLTPRAAAAAAVYAYDRDMAGGPDDALADVEGGGPWSIAVSG